MYNNYIDEIISDLHKKKPDIKVRLEQLDIAIRKLSGNKDDNSHIRGSFSFDWDLREASSRILVHNYNHFHDIQQMFKRAVLRAGKSLTQVGFLNSDVSKRKTWVSEL